MKFKRQRIYKSTNSRPTKILVASTEPRLNYLASLLTKPKSILYESRA